MDFVSHALIGRAIATSPKNSRMNIFWVILFSTIPDFPVAVMYFYLGIHNSRPFGIALDSDWIGFGQIHYFLSTIYNSTHSIFFAFTAVILIILYFKLPKIAFLAYFLHICSDLFTHSGEWSIKLFYPFQFQIEGFSNIWSWPVWGMAVFWVVLIIVIILIEIYYKHLN